MGVFSKLRKSKPSTNNTLVKAVLTPSVMTMISDGSADDSELAQLSNLCSFSPIFAGQSSEALVELMKEIVKELSSGDIPSLIQNTKAALTMPMRETSVLFAMRIALADGRIDDGEKKSLIILGEQFEIPEDKFMQMFDVIAMLQRGPEHANS